MSIVTKVRYNLAVYISNVTREVAMQTYCFSSPCVLAHTWARCARPEGPAADLLCYMSNVARPGAVHTYYYTAIVTSILLSTLGLASALLPI